MRSPSVPVVVPVVNDTVRFVLVTAAIDRVVVVLMVSVVGGFGLLQSGEVIAKLIEYGILQSGLVTVFELIVDSGVSAKRIRDQFNKCWTIE